MSTFKKNTVFSSEIIKEILSDKIGKKLTSNDILNMKNCLNNFYQDNGYKSAVVSVLGKNAEQGSITFIITKDPKIIPIGKLNQTSSFWIKPKFLIALAFMNS